MTGPDLARFLIRNRGQIEARMAAQLGAAAPRASSAEAELLRRFRSYASASLSGGDAPEPALEGVRVHDRRAAALLDHWIAAAADAGGRHADAIEQALKPLSQTLVGRLRQGAGPRRARGAPRAKRRAVSAAIDRVADAFFAVETDTGQIVDANPAAGSLLGVARDALLGVDALSFVAPDRQTAWWSELDAMAEGGEPRRFENRLRDAHGHEIDVSCSLTRFATRDRTLALVLARPL